jgi:rod shape determining protein RodA
MHPWLRKLVSMNWVLFLLMFGLMIYGVYAIYSATWMISDQRFWTSQMVWIMAALPVFFLVSLIDYRWIRLGAVPCYVLSVLGLVAVLLFGERRYGAQCWLNLGFMSVQPSQFAVLAGIMTIAVYLEATRKIAPVLRILGCGAIVGAPWLLILVEPDLGMCIVWVPIVLALLFAGDVPKRWLLSMIILGLAMVPLIVNFALKPYQHARITSFVNPYLDPQGDGWNIIQSLTAIGSGGFYGKGFKASNTLNELGYLPTTIKHNDFIFSVLGEQHGFVGGVLLIAALALLLFTGLYIAIKAEDGLGQLLAVGIVALIFTYTFLNIGMTISITPITGLPLPLISYGGSFLMMILFSLGILQSIWIHRKTVR